MIINSNHEIMKKQLFLICIVCVYFSCNNINKKPEEITRKFYNLLNEGNFEEAKKYATPSAIEYIDGLKSICNEYSIGDTIPFEIMDVEKQESPKEGDVAIVNYKIGINRSFVKLQFTDGAYKVIFFNELLNLRIIEFNSINLYNLRINDWDNYKNLTGYRVRIKNLLIAQEKRLDGEFNNDIYIFPYDKLNNSIPIAKPDRQYGVTSHRFSFNGNEVEYTGIKKDKWGCFDEFFRISDRKIIKQLNFPMDIITFEFIEKRISSGYGALCESWVANFTQTYTMEGILTCNSYRDELKNIIIYKQKDTTSLSYVGEQKDKQKTNLNQEKTTSSYEGEYFNSDKFTKITLLNGNKFIMTVSVCEGSGIIKGTYSVEKDKLIFKYKEKDFKGFAGDEQNSFDMNIISNTELEYKGVEIGCSYFTSKLFVKSN
jgi:hypothetical protein